MEAQREMVNSVGRKSRDRVIMEKKKEGEHIRNIRDRLLHRDRQLPVEVYSSKIAQENKRRIAGKSRWANVPNIVRMLLTRLLLPL